MSMSRSGGKRGHALLLGVVCFVSIVTLIPYRTGAEVSRRIGIGFHPGFFILDGDFFGLENGPATELRFRYEFKNNIYFENRFGCLFSRGSGTSVGGLTYQMGITAVLPYLIPYRPIAAAGIGFLSVDPVTVTPTDTFRPSQTTFYFILGGGMTRSIREHITIEAMASLWITPYSYRIYRFNRSSVESEDKQFAHVSLQIGITYIF